MKNEKFPVRLEVFYYHRGKKSVDCEMSIMLSLEDILDLTSKGPEWAFEVAHSNKEISQSLKTAITIKWNRTCVHGQCWMYVGEVPYKVFAAFHRKCGKNVKFKHCPEHKIQLIRNKISRLENEKNAIEFELKHLNAVLNLCES